MENYGADALRLYLITSGLVKAEDQRFSDSVLKIWVAEHYFLGTMPQNSLKPTQKSTSGQLESTFS